MPKITEAAFNLALSRVLAGKNPAWTLTAESTYVFQEAAQRPDIVIQVRGMQPIIIEAEYWPAATVENDARQRLGRNLAGSGTRIEQVVALRVPKGFPELDQSRLDEQIGKADFGWRLLSGDPADPCCWPAEGWISGGVDDLARFLESAMLSEDRLKEGLDIIEMRVSQASYLLRQGCADIPNVLQDLADILHQEESEQTTRMAMAIIMNAMSYHVAIEGRHGIPPLSSLGERGRLSPPEVMRCWYDILQVNYWPIFGIARSLLIRMPLRFLHEIMDRLVNAVNRLSELGITSRRDMAGRLFQQLIADRKFLATFYTLPASAALLAELAVSRLDVDWSDAAAVKNLRIADFACGTGALLCSAYESALSRYRRFGRDDREIHAEMMENALIGADIMPAAAHLTASQLSAFHPGVTFSKTNIYTLAYGRESTHRVHLGALDLVDAGRAASVFASGETRLGGEGEQRADVSVGDGSVDLVIMNPPFTRSTNHERRIAGAPVPCFAGFDTPAEEQRVMGAQLKKMSRPGQAGHGNAGLGSNFVDLAHLKARPGGASLAFILPFAAVSGNAWANFRKLLDRECEDVLVLSIARHETYERAFSADTAMAECMVVATKRARPLPVAAGAKPPPWTYANLLRRPGSVSEAIAVACELRRSNGGGLARRLYIGSQYIGHAIRGASSDGGLAAVGGPDVAEAVGHILAGRLKLPRMTESFPIPVTTLSEIGNRGLYHLDIGRKSPVEDDSRGPFVIRPIRPHCSYSALWSHSAEKESRLVVSPDREAVVRPELDDKAMVVWQTATRLHFNSDFQLNSQPLAACMTQGPTLGGRAWPNFAPAEPAWEPLLALWANGTLGLLSWWWAGTRQQQGRSCITITALPDLLTINPRALPEEAVARASGLFEEFAQRDFLPANEAWRDPARMDLDRALLVDLLELPEDVLEPLALLRRQWCAEPSVHGGKKTAPPFDA